MNFEPKPVEILSPEFVTVDALLLVGYLAHDGHRYFASVELPPFVAGDAQSYGNAVHFARAKSSGAIKDMLNLVLADRRRN